MFLNVAYTIEHPSKFAGQSRVSAHACTEYHMQVCYVSLLYNPYIVRACATWRGLLRSYDARTSDCSVNAVAGPYPHGSRAIGSTSPAWVHAHI